MSRVHLWLIPAVIMGASFAAHSATRTVCLELIIHDERVDCPSSGTGVRSACNPGGAVNATGTEFELWDKDSGSADEYIGRWYIGSGEGCVTFEWENASYSKGELNPDVYFVAHNRVWASGSNESIRIEDDNNNIYAYPSSRNGWGGNPDAGTAVDCTNGANCYIAGGAGVYIHSNAFSDYGQALMALDSVQRSLAIYHTRLNSGTISLEYPDSSGACPTACTNSRKKITVPPGLADEGFRMAHEMGHVVHMGEFIQDDLRNDCSANGPGWSLDSQENDSCAVAEGWATYVAAVSWWDPNNSGSVPTGFGVDHEAAKPTWDACAANRGVALQVSRAFWDLDDWNNESGVDAAAGSDDLSSNSTLGITSGWSDFANGTANREDFEIGAHGVNLYDYDFNKNYPDETLFDHNCLTSQAP